MQLSFLIFLCFISTHVSHAYGNERCICFGLCWQPTKDTAKPLSGTQSLLSTLGQGTANDNSLLCDHTCGMLLENSLMDLANRSVWEVFLKEEVD